MGKILEIILGILFVALISSPATAENAKPCQLIKLTSLDMATSPDGTFSIPAVFNETPVRLTVDTGSDASSIVNEVALEMNAKRVYMRGGVFMNNIGVNTGTYIDSFRIGMIHSEDRWGLLIVPNSLVSTTVSGLLGPDIMRDFDVEFDFLHNKFNLFKRDECPGDPVYWTHDAYAAVSFAQGAGSQIVVPASLDGQSVRVFIDTGSSISTMSLAAARKLFGLAENDPRVKFTRYERINGGAWAPQYTFPFASLSLEGVAISNPQIQLLPQNSFDLGRPGNAEVVLGMTVLRQLHMYVDYGDQTIYFTGAETQ